MATTESIAIASVGAAAAVAAPLIGPPLLTPHVVLGSLAGSVVALLFFFKSQEHYDAKVILDAILIFITGMAAAIFGTSTVAFLLKAKFGIDGDGVGLISLVLAFQGKQMFMMASQLREFFAKKITKE
jgi:hypothetical protein